MNSRRCTHKSSDFLGIRSVAMVEDNYIFLSLENAKNYQSATWLQHNYDLCQNVVSNGGHVDSWDCCKFPSFGIPVVPVCCIKQSPRYI